MQTGLKRIVIAIAVVMGVGSLPAQADIRLAAGTSWVNELGSVLTITSIAPNGLMSGTYTSRVGCGAGKAQPMTGWYFAGASGGAITFSVSWQGCDSVTSWSGQVDYAAARFQALWYLALAAKPTWNGINAGTDSYAPIPPMPK